MRALFNKTGSSAYHVILHPNLLPAMTIYVPSNQGVLLQSGRGVIFADISISWWAAQIQNLETAADPTHLAIYLTNNVLLHVGQNVFSCCVIGFHGTRAAGAGGGSNNSNGNAKVQTFAWASWIQPGIYARPSGGTDWAVQDIHALSHEIAEWAEDPFVNNTVEPWRTPTAPQYGCSGGRDRFCDGYEYLRAGAKPQRFAKRRRVLPPRGRGVSPMVHADVSQQYLGADPEHERRALHVHGRPQPLPGLPPARHGLQLNLV
jgi:hypothetical protein